MESGHREESPDREYSLKMSFWIDTDAYSPRDRDMFVAGYEFCLVVGMIEGGWRGSRPIHRENESRMRMACGKLGVQCSIEPHSGYEGCDSWSEITVLES